MKFDGIEWAWAVASLNVQGGKLCSNRSSTNLSESENRLQFVSMLLKVFC